jgi:hypothetical protein
MGYSMDESVWYKRIENQVHVEVERLYRRDYRFYHVDTFLNISRKLDAFSSDCPVCSEMKQVSEEIAGNLSELLKGDISLRRTYEKKLEALRAHLQADHQIYPKGYYSSFYSFIGIVSGLVSGYIFAFFINQGWMKESLIMGSVFGLIIGRVYGILKDKMVRSEGRNLN